MFKQFLASHSKDAKSESKRYRPSSKTQFTKLSDLLVVKDSESHFIEPSVLSGEEEYGSQSEHPKRMR